MLDGPPEQHQPGGLGAAAPDQGRQRHRVGVPVVGDLRRVLDGVLEQAETVLPALVDLRDDAQRQVVEALPRRSVAPAGPGPPAAPRARAGPGRGGPARGGAAGGCRRASVPRRRTYYGRASAGRAPAAGTVGAVSPSRRCSRTACGRAAVSTLTFVYADQTAVLGPLSTYAEPHAYDLCAPHGERLSVPRGWEVLRLAPDPQAGRPHDRRPARPGRRRPGGGPARRPSRRCTSRRPAARPPGAVTCGCSPPTDRQGIASDRALHRRRRPGEPRGRLQGLRRARARCRTRSTTSSPDGWAPRSSR